MSDDALHERGKNLEEAFFRKQDEMLKEQMRAKLKAQENRQALREATGIEDEKVLDDLIGHGIRAETLAAVAIIPMVVVAWADGSLEKREREAVMKGAAQSGISEDSPAYQLIESWLRSPPEEELMTAWRQYIAALARVLDGPRLSELEKTITDRATSVAKAAGGFLGLGGRISTQERQVLDEIRRTFHTQGAV